MIAAEMPFKIGDLVERKDKEGLCRVLGYQEKHGELCVLLADVTNMFHPQPIFASPFHGLKKVTSN